MSYIPGKFDTVNLYFQEEARFGMKTLVGYCLSAIGVRPKVKYQHKFANTYLWGSYSPINGDSFVWEINGVDTFVFEAYLKEFSKQNLKEYKIVVMDNAGFHSTQNIEVLDNIYLLRIPPYTPELNPCEQVWQYIKQRFNPHYSPKFYYKAKLPAIIADALKLFSSKVSNTYFTNFFLHSSIFIFHNQI